MLLFSEVQDSHSDFQGLSDNLQLAQQSRECDSQQILVQESTTVTISLY